MEIKKIPLEGLIEVLLEIYNGGVDYIDMKVEQHDRQDHIWFFETASSSPVPPPLMKELPKEENVDFESLIM